MLNEVNRRADAEPTPDTEAGSATAGSTMSAKRNSRAGMMSLPRRCSGSSPLFVFKAVIPLTAGAPKRSEEHTSELQSLMRISYAVFCLKKKKKTETQHENNHRKT